MSVILFIIVLALLILVHELGHFCAAKSVGARVDEFGIGFPPRAYSWKKEGSETTYSINWIPFGGFVKILGENGDLPADADPNRSLTNKSKWAQAWVLAAGVIFNVIFAWLIISFGFLVGFPSVVTPDTKGVQGTPQVTILEVTPDSPAAKAGLKTGDVIESLGKRFMGLDQQVVSLPMRTVEDVQRYIGTSPGEEILVTYLRDKQEAQTMVIPTEGIVPDRGAIGISLDLVANVRLPILQAFWQGAQTTWYFLKSTAVGLWSLIAGAFHGTAHLSQVSGPVGIVGMVGDAARRGLMAVLSFAAIISLNLAVINLVPFPALDGGRLLFVAIEGITRRRLPEKVTMWANGIGFALLILLMVIITVHDVVKLFA